MKFGYVSLLPETALATKFLQELGNNRLMGTRCKKCGAKYLPPRAHCACGSADVEWYEAPKEGKLLAYTTVLFPPESLTKYAPYHLAIAELDDGSRLLAHLGNVMAGNVDVGMRVKIRVNRISEERLTYEFTPL